MTKLKAILLLVAIFILTTISAYFFEEYYRQFIRDLFMFFNRDCEIFAGKNFHLFASELFIFSFGLFSVLISIFTFRQRKKNMLFKFLLTIALFFLTTITTSYFDSKAKVFECTNCNDNKRTLHLQGINYDLYFILSLTVALLPMCLSSLTKSSLTNSNDK